VPRADSLIFSAIATRFRPKIGSSMTIPMGGAP
jgi:hypothetical protein